jgi:hypothetical protein
VVASVGRRPRADARGVSAIRPEFASTWGGSGGREGRSRASQGLHGSLATPPVERMSVR